jgi:hypothetical protein
MYSFDFLMSEVIGELTIGKSFGAIEAGEAHEFMSAMRSRLDMWRYVFSLPMLI